MTRTNKSVLEEPVAMYITDAGIIGNFTGAPSFWTSLKENRYFPLLDLISIKSKSELRFTTGEGISGDLIAYNEHTSSQRLSKAIINRSKIDVTSNDLFVGGIMMCLNFTKYNVTVVSDFGIPKMFRPLDSDNFPEYDGELVFFRIHTLNSPQSVRNVHGQQNYLENIFADRSGAVTPNERESVAVIQFVLNNLHSNKSVTDAAVSDTLKVVTVFKVREEEFQLRSSGEHKDVYLHNKGLLLSLHTPTGVSVHPALKEALTNDRDVLEAIKANGVSCFIIDNDDAIGDRYFNFAGQVIKIPKLKSKENVNGLYVGSIDNSKHFSVENITDLDKIDENKYVYKSAEEALDGADLKTKYMEQSEMRKIIRAEEAQNSKLEYEARYRELDEKSRARINELEEESRKSKLQHEDEIRKMSVQLEKLNTEGNAQKHNLETETMYRKNQFEATKYERDNFIETLKTVGAVAGLALGIFALMSKFSK